MAETNKIYFAGVELEKICYRSETNEISVKFDVLMGRKNVSNIFFRIFNDQTLPNTKDVGGLQH